MLNYDAGWAREVVEEILDHITSTVSEPIGDLDDEDRAELEDELVDKVIGKL